MFNKTKNNLKFIILIHLSLFIFSLSGVFAKNTALYDFFSSKFILFYLIELVFIGLYAIVWQQVLKKFELSVAYANRGSIFIWTFLWSILFFQETIPWTNILGAVIITIGIVVVFKND